MNDTDYPDEIIILTPDQVDSILDGVQVTVEADSGRKIEVNVEDRRRKKGKKKRKEKKGADIGPGTVLLLEKKIWMEYNTLRWQMTEPETNNGSIEAGVLLTFDRKSLDKIDPSYIFVLKNRRDTQISDSAELGLLEIRQFITDGVLTRIRGEGST